MSGASVKLHQYSCRRDVLMRALTFGIKPGDLGDMLKKSARITHPKGNRRFHDYVFMIEGREVTAISRIDESSGGTAVVELERELSKLNRLMASAMGALRYCTEQIERLKRDVPGPSAPDRKIGCMVCNDTGKQVVFDQCENNGGECRGCDHCDGGLVRSSIPCSACVNRREGKLVVRQHTMV